MGDGGKGSDGERSDGAGTSDDVQGGGSDGAILWEKELGSDGGNAEGAGGVSPPVDWRIVRMSAHIFGEGGWGGSANFWWVPWRMLGCVQ